MKSFRMLALAGVSLASIAMPAMAQDAPSQQTATGDTLEEETIIVTARRRDEDVQDVPQTVNVVTAAEIQKLNLRDGGEIQNLVPGLQLRSEANGIGSSAQVRGIQYDINTSASPTVAFYLNDAPVEAGVVLQTLYDVGQVAVERGPQGTLRGLSTPSGAIVVTTRKPDLERFGGYAQATGNTIGTINFNGALGIPVIPGIAAIRVAGAFDSNMANRVRTIERDGDYRDPYAEQQAGRISALVTPTDWLRIEGVYQRTDRKSRTFAQYESANFSNPAVAPTTPVIRAEDRLSIQETPSLFDQKYEIYNWRGELRAAGQKLIYQGQKSNFDVFSDTNTDAANFLNGRDFRQRTTTKSRQTTHEVRIQNEERVTGIFDYVAGYFNSKLAVDTDLTLETGVFLPTAFGGGLATVATTPIAVRRAAPGREESFFGNLTAHIGSTTEVSGGLRHIDTTNPGGILRIATNTLTTPGKNDKGFVYMGSIKHNFSDDFMVYGMTGTSRRAGPNVTGDFSVVKSARQLSFQELPTETSRSYELGFKSSLFDKRLRLNVTGFHQTFKNYPYRSPTGIYYVSNSATVTGGVVTIVPTVAQFNFVAPVPVEVNGVEGELSFNVTPSWSIGLVASYALGKIKNGLTACNDLNNDGIPDNITTPPTLAQLQAVVGANNVSACRVSQRSSFQSPFSATLQSEFQQPLSGRTDAFLRGIYSFNGRSQGDPTFQFDQVDAYGLLNLFTGIRASDGQWEVSLFAKNILKETTVTRRDAQAVTSIQRLTLPAFTPVGEQRVSGYSQIQTTAPREFGLNFRFAFGSR